MGLRRGVLWGMAVNEIRYATIVVAVLACAVEYRFMKEIKDVPKPETKWEKMYFQCMPFALLLLSLYLTVRTDAAHVFDCWKLVAVAALLWPVAYIDWKTNTIPNEWILQGIAVRGMIWICELLYQPADAAARIAADLLGCVILLCVCIMLRFFSRNGLGMGDVKLLSILPLFFGMINGFTAVIYSLLVVFVQSCYFLITKKKGKKDVIPMCPSILVGCVITILLKG